MSKLNLELACDKLRLGSVIAYPTEAVWGLGCDPGSQSAVSRILQLKNRPAEKGLILVAADLEQIKSLTDSLSKEQLALLESSWPGPVTWLLPDPNSLIPAWIKGKHLSVAVRISSHPIVHKLCAEFGGPLVSTSANRAGEPGIRSRLILEQKFATNIDYIVPGEVGTEANPSEIRDLVSGKIIR